jgi:hypothetical protein
MIAFRYLNYSVLLFLFSFMIITSCKKEEEHIDKNTSSAVDHAFAESTFDDAGIMADQAAISGDLTTYKNGVASNTSLSTCATISFDTTASPRIITIDFDTVNGPPCLDGRYRRGKIIVTYNGGYRDAGSVHTISFDDYYVNDYKVEGTKTVTNGGQNSAGNTYFNIDVVGHIISPQGATLDWTSTRVREWVSGEGTVWWIDDIYHITGSASGNSFGGEDFTAQITEPLVVDLACVSASPLNPKPVYLKEGVLEFTPDGKYTRVIDYGYENGECDNKAKVTIADFEFVIILR